MRHLLLFPLAAALGLSSPVSAAAQVRTPEEVADLYLRMFVNTDVAAAQALNAYLKPAYDGREPFDVAAMRQAIADKPAADRARAQAAAETEGPDGQREAYAEGVLAMGRLMDAVLAHARCKATGSDIAPNEATRALDERSREDDIATVAFRCQVPEVGQAAADALAGDDAIALRKATDAQRALIESGQARMLEVEGRQNLYRSTGSPIWLTGSTDEWMAPVLQTLP